MDTGLTTSSDEKLRQLKGDLELTQTKLRQREAALGVLNRRLLSLERRSADSGHSVRDPATALAIAERDALALQNKLLTEELQLMRKTKLFRYAAPLRRIYAITKQA